MSTATGSARQERATRARADVGRPTDRALVAALARCGGGVSAEGYRRWRVRLPGSRRFARVALCDSWLRCFVTLGSARKRIDLAVVEAALAYNARLEGCARLVAPADKRRLEADVPGDALPLEDEAELDAMLETMLGDLAAGLDDSAANALGSAVAVVGDGTDEAATTQRERLEPLFAEAGWPIAAGDGALRVPLDVPGHYVAAELAERPGRLRLRAALPVAAESSDPGGAAAGLLIWRVACAHRLVKPERSRAGLALVVTVPHVRSDTHAPAHACAALSAALRAMVGEVELVMTDARLAQLFLHAQGVSSDARAAPRASSSFHALEMSQEE